MVSVPAAYQAYVQEAAQGTGLPAGVVAAQAQAESNFNAGAVSSAGAEGWLQFEPATYNAYAAQSGVAPGSEFNPAAETKVYITYMNSLLNQEGGSVFKALEAYNAGPGNLAAGQAYASSILQNAGVSQNATAGKITTTATTTGLPLPWPFSWLPIPGVSGSSISTSGIFSVIFQGFAKALGFPSFTDIFQRLGLILLGVGLIFLGIHLLGGSFGGIAKVAVAATPEGRAAEVAGGTSK